MKSNSLRMAGRIATAFVLLAAACAQPATEPKKPTTDTARTETVPAAADSPTPSEPPAQRAGNVTIGDITMANPIVIRGTARTFENGVNLRVRDERGSVISEGFTTATGDMGHFNPYTGSLFVTRDPGSRVTVEALEYSAKDGSEQSLVRETRAWTVEPVEVTLYFPDQACTGVAAFRRRVPKSVSLARLLVEALVRGPISAERGASNPFPQGSGVTSVILRDGVLTVDFNERLRNVGGSCRAQMIREAVTKTLVQLPSVKRVVITAGGSEALALQP